VGWIHYRKNKYIESMRNYPDQRPVFLRRRHILILCLALLVTACSGAGVSSGPSDSTPATPSTPPPPAPPPGGTDSTNPSIAITAPTSASSMSTPNGSITLGGNAGDDVAVTRVSWTNSAGGSGSQNFSSTNVNWNFTVALQSGTNVLTVTARDAAGNTMTDQLTVTRTANTNVANLSWDANTETDVVGYRVYYGTSPGSYLQVRGAGIDVTSGTGYTVTGLTSGVRYYFVVTAFDGSGNESDYSREVSKDIP